MLESSLDHPSLSTYLHIPTEIDAQKHNHNEHNHHNCPYERKSLTPNFEIPHQKSNHHPQRTYAGNKQEHNQ